eukprot:12314-Pelagococcus_subviridis.AAC.2
MSSPPAVAVAPNRDSRREVRDKSLSSFAFPRKRPRRRNFLVSAVAVSAAAYRISFSILSIPSLVLRKSTAWSRTSGEGFDSGGGDVKRDDEAGFSGGGPRDDRALDAGPATTRCRSSSSSSTSLSDGADDASLTTSDIVCRTSRGRRALRSGVFGDGCGMRRRGPSRGAAACARGALASPRKSR